MMIVADHEVGHAAWSRLARDGLVAPLTASSGVPLDRPATSAVRAESIARWVPERAAVTGLSALWIWGNVPGPCPLPFGVAVARGRHPDAPPGVRASDWAWHTDGAAQASAATVGPVLVTRPAFAIATALRVDDLGRALVAAASALRAGACALEEVDAAISAGAGHAVGRARQLNAWAAMRAISQVSGAERR